MKGVQGNPQRVKGLRAKLSAKDPAAGLPAVS